MEAIGIIGAMEEEIAALKNQMKDIEAAEASGSVFYKGILQEQKVVLVRSGIGKVNAAVCAQTLINVFNTGCIINAGVAGGIDKRLHIGDVVISEDAVHHDFDSVIFGEPVGVIPHMEESFFKAESRLVKLAEEAAKAVLKQQSVFIGRIASGDQFIADSLSKDRIRENFGALCVEMEGAAIAQTAYLNKVPFVIIRAISDSADGDAMDSFSAFLESSAKNTTDIVEYIIKNYVTD